MYWPSAKENGDSIMTNSSHDVISTIDSNTAFIKQAITLTSKRMDLRR
jgi:hypothetical protein